MGHGTTAAPMNGLDGMRTPVLPAAGLVAFQSWQTARSGAAVSHGGHVALLDAGLAPQFQFRQRGPRVDTIAIESDAT
jgi:hypothetical protein